MIDRSLMVTLLTVLREQRDLKPGTEESALFNDVNLRATSAVTLPLLREHTNLADDKGWIEMTKGSLGERRWRITPLGSSELSDLQHGG